MYATRMTSAIKHPSHHSAVPVVDCVASFPVRRETFVAVVTRTPGAIRQQRLRETFVAVVTRATGPNHRGATHDPTARPATRTRRTMNRGWLKHGNSPAIHQQRLGVALERAGM